MLVAAVDDWLLAQEVLHRSSAGCEGARGLWVAWRVASVGW